MAETKRQLTEKQKKWVLDRDEHRCQFYTYYSGRGLVRCPNTKDLAVHHIKPFRWLSFRFQVVIETPYNLITLCHHPHHLGRIHPDMADALRQYHVDKNSISKVLEVRNKMVAQNIPYWVTTFDDILKFIAKMATDSYIKKHPFPDKGER